MPHRHSQATYTTHGSVRGGCGHQYQSIALANACADRDRRHCGSLGGGAYSDRGVTRGNGDALDDQERDELADVEAGEDAQ